MSTPVPFDPSDALRGRAASSTGLERHSIDWIPDAERHGKASDLGAIWFVGNANLTAMATGVTTLSVGLDLGWTIVATVLGSLFGTFFMAFHSAQGPQLGLPQLVQSRPQFGYLGAALTVWVFALINYVAYNTSDALLSGDAMHILFGFDTQVGYFIAGGFAAVIALYGYRWIHRVNRVVAWPLLVVLVLLTVGALRGHGLPAQPFALGSFDLAGFMTVFTIVAGFQLGWAPYVSDYSRYLPASIGVRSTFWWTYLPSGLSAIWVFVVGNLAFAVDPKATPVAAFKVAGDALFPGFGSVAVAGLLIGLLSVMAVNQYGGMMSLISIRDSFRPVRANQRIRLIGIAIMFVLVWGSAQFVGVERFNAFYGNVLIFLAYLFTPWTAINLVDYFFVRRGRYVIRAIFERDGIYGRWGWRGTVAYLATMAAMVPFMVTTPYTGFVAAALGGVDYSMFVGLPLAGGLYWWLCRSLDLAAEGRLVDAEGLLPTAASPRGERTAATGVGDRQREAVTDRRDSMNEERAVLAGGCFWGMQDLVRKRPGVISTRVGYTGGRVANATYRNHDGHAEAIEIVFDPSIVSFRTLLEFFFQIHDPTTKDRQGNDRGSSYRSAIFTTSDEQASVAKDTIADVEASGLWPGRVVTEVVPAREFWEAEPEHQDYLERIPHGYTCHFVRPGWKLPHRETAGR